MLALDSALVILGTNVLHVLHDRQERYCIIHLRAWSVSNVLCFHTIGHQLLMLQLWPKRATTNVQP